MDTLQQQDYAKLLENALDFVCPKCGKPTFEQVIIIKRISALLSPDGKGSLIPLPVYRCTECKYIIQSEDMDGSSSKPKQGGMILTK